MCRSARFHGFDSVVVVRNYSCPCENVNLDIHVCVVLFSLRVGLFWIAEEMKASVCSVNAGIMIVVRRV